MKLKILTFTVIISILLTFIGWMFWEQEVKFVLPSPIPTNFVEVKVGSFIDLKNIVDIKNKQPALLHFFNFDCACSRFNIEEFERISRKYEDSLHMMVVIQSEDEKDLKKFQDKYGLEIPTILDDKGEISDQCGIYATPQAVILDQNSKIYFKGNYNKARFCTRKETKFVDLALTHLLNNKPLPEYVEKALPKPFGCSLPSDADHLEDKS